MIVREADVSWGWISSSLRSQIKDHKCGFDHGGRLLLSPQEHLGTENKRGDGKLITSAGKVFPRILSSGIDVFFAK